jgi:hypothetical protein
VQGRCVSAANSGFDSPPNPPLPHRRVELERQTQFNALRAALAIRLPEGGIRFIDSLVDARHRSGVVRERRVP